MPATPEVSITLSVELLDHLHRCAAELRVPLEWFVAGLVCDTIESLVHPHSPGPAAALMATPWLSESLLH